MNVVVGFSLIYFCALKNLFVIGEVFTLGYLTGSQRRAGNLEYAKPGECDLCFAPFLHSLISNTFRFFRFPLELN